MQLAVKEAKAACEIKSQPNKARKEAREQDHPPGKALQKTCMCPMGTSTDGPTTRLKESACLFFSQPHISIDSGQCYFLTRKNCRAPLFSHTKNREYICMRRSQQNVGIVCSYFGGKFLVHEHFQLKNQLKINMQFEKKDGGIENTTIIFMVYHALLRAPKAAEICFGSR